jgi:hypothetical protein
VSRPLSRQCSGAVAKHGDRSRTPYLWAEPFCAKGAPFVLVRLQSKDPIQATAPRTVEASKPRPDVPTLALKE